MELVADQQRPKIYGKIGFIGGGNMARAIFDGITNKEIVEANQICVSGPHLENLSYFTKKGAFITVENGQIIEMCSVVFICVKPQKLVEVIRTLISYKKYCSNVVFVSVLAGTTLNTIESVFQTNLGVNNLKLVRVMPNTPMAIGEGCSMFTCQNLLENEENIVKILLESCGLCIQVAENQINAMAAVSGSGPAYMYLILEAMADGGVKMGVPRQIAVQLATQTMLGAAKMAQMSSKHSAQLKDEVCSAGGTTIAGMYALEKGGVRSAIIEAIENATKRAMEMEKSGK